MVKVIRNGEETYVIQKPYKYIGDKELNIMGIIILLILSGMLFFWVNWILGIIALILGISLIVHAERFYLRESKAAEIWISTDRIRVLIENEVYKEIIFDEEVNVSLFLSNDIDVYHFDDDFRNWVDLDVEDNSIMVYGPLSGYHITKGKTVIWFADDGGWNIQDIRDLWDVMLGIIEAKRLSLGEDLLRYIELKEKVNSSP